MRGWKRGPPRCGRGLGTAARAVASVKKEAQAAIGERRLRPQDQLWKAVAGNIAAGEATGEAKGGGSVTAAAVEASGRPRRSPPPWMTQP